MPYESWVPLCVVVLATAVAAVTDIWKFRVYNVLTIPLFLSGLVYHGIAGGWTDGISSALGGLFGFGVLFVPYLLGLMGAGDVKLLAGVGAWFGLWPTVLVFVLSSLVSGVYATVLIVYRGRIGESWATFKLIFYRFATIGSYFVKDDLLEAYATSSDRRLRVIPFGAMISCGVIGALVFRQYLN